MDDYEKLDYRYLTGTLPLSYLGCTYVERLVVTGPRAGSVWIDDEGRRMACIADSFDEYINKKISDSAFSNVVKRKAKAGKVK